MLVQTAIMPDGSLCGTHVARSLDKNYGMDQAALDAIAQWQFAPRPGADVSVGANFTYGFGLSNWRGATPYNMWFPDQQRGETMPFWVGRVDPQIDPAVKQAGLKLALEVRGTVQTDGHFTASGVDVVGRSGGTPADGAIVMREILKAVEQWTFHPATNATGSPIPHAMTVVVHFPF